MTEAMVIRFRRFLLVMLLAYLNMIFFFVAKSTTGLFFDGVTLLEETERFEIDLPMLCFRLFLSSPRLK